MPKFLEMSIGPTVMRKEPIIYVHYFRRGRFIPTRLAAFILFLFHQRPK